MPAGVSIIIFAGDISKTFHVSLAFIFDIIFLCEELSSQVIYYLNFFPRSILSSLLTYFES